MLRAGPFSDERVVRLINRRFIPFYFDLSDRGFAGDPDAREFVVDARKDLGGRSVSTPQVLFMTPDGKVVATADNYATEDAILKTLLKIVSDNPTWAKPSEEETAAETPLAQGRIAFDLHDLKRAEKLLARSDAVEALFLRAKIARYRGRWHDHEKILASIDGEEHEETVAVETGHRLWRHRAFEDLEKTVARVSKQCDRYTEARYHLGLALWHGRKKKEARRVWREAIESCPQDAWIYRTDWAYTQSKGKSGRRAFSTSDRRESPLNRIGYMGRRNPDLDGPPKSGTRRDI